jgi:glycosyltransferase involved in cell wall biosynthesis
MERFISIVIPNHNNVATIGKCLEAIFTSEYRNFEVIVVDDSSTDSSVDIIRQYPCRLICFKERRGASAARNTGAINSNGEIIFFIDADCIIAKDTLTIVNRIMSEHKPDTVIGGTYTPVPSDRDFFSRFQSAYIHYSETKNPDRPDYIASHAMVIYAETFRKHHGFLENFMPILEDVELSHRLKKAGCRLLMYPDIQVKRIFNFNLFKSLKNAFRKTKYWTIYSIKNRDALTDSGTASIELKSNVFLYSLSLVFLSLGLILKKYSLFYIIGLLFILNFHINWRLFSSFYKTGGILFFLQAYAYYTFIYPIAVEVGTLSGVKEYLMKKWTLT